MVAFIIVGNSTCFRSCVFHIWLLPDGKCHFHVEVFVLQEAESNRNCRRLQLKDIIPVETQRLTKYPLLLENIAKYTGTAASFNNNMLNIKISANPTNIIYHVMSFSLAKLHNIKLTTILNIKISANLTNNLYHVMFFH